MADYITYNDLKKAVTDTGRPYDLEMLDKAYTLARPTRASSDAPASLTSATR